MRVGNIDQLCIEQMVSQIKRYREQQQLCFPTGSSIKTAVFYQLERILLIKTVMEEEGTEGTL